MSELITAPGDHPEQPEYSLTIEEDILLEVEDGGGSLASRIVIHEIGGNLPAGSPGGYATMQNCEFGLFEYELEDLIRGDGTPGPGFYVLEAVSADFHQGDGWTTDDDYEVSTGQFRPATPEEIENLCLSEAPSVPAP